MTEIEEYVQAQCERHQIPGISVAVAHAGQVMVSARYGLANVEQSVSATENTVYQIASVTKQFTATAIMMLTEDGVFGLDDLVAERLPGLPNAWEAVTIRHLLSHTSGIKNYTGTKDFAKNLRKDFSPSEIIDLVRQEPLEFVPGEKSAYSNTGYFLLGLLIEHVTGKTFGTFLNERIFQPLAMGQTRVNDLRAIIPDRAQGYSWDGMVLRNGEYVSPSQPFAAGALVSTVRDLLKWDVALYTTQLLTQASLDQMWTPMSLNQGTVAEFGLGWVVGEVNGHRLLSHSGGIPGFASHIARFVDDQLTVIVLMNVDSADAGALAHRIAAIVLPGLAKEAEEALPDTDPHLTEQITRRVLDAAETGADGELFADVRKQLPARPHEQAQLAPLGVLQALRLHEKIVTEEEMILRYRAVFAVETLLLTAWVDKAGAITRLRLRREY